ncbi:MAG: ABC transporter ATP-binding protein [Planctomycetota bacterium]
MSSERLILETKQLRRAFSSPGGKVEVLKGVDLRIREGEILAIQGPSGVGKSTLLNILGLLDDPTGGDLFFYHENGRATNSTRISGKGRAALRNDLLGFVFQFYHLLPDVNVVENVMLPTMMRCSWWRYGRRKKEVRERAMQLLARVGITDRATHKPSTLSGGERQRAAIARALMNRPRLLLCDEPTGNLDMETSEQIHELFTELNETLGSTILIVTHDTHLAAQSHRQLTMIDGRFDTPSVAATVTE